MTADRRFSCTVLTGATGGLGQVFAERLAAVSDHLVITGRRQEALNDLCERLGPLHTHTLAGDLNQAQTRTALTDRVRMLGGCDLLIHNAGVNEFHRFSTQSEASIEAVMQANLVTPMLLTRQLLPHMVSAHQAQIVLIGSGLGQVGFPGFAAYCASKFGLRGFSEALQRELANEVLRVRYFAPRATATDINSPEVLAMNQALGAPMDTPQRVADLFMQFLFNDHAMQQVGATAEPEPLADAAQRLGVDTFFAQALPAIQAHLPG
jgi:short-subunit dehydrogenase